MVRTRYASLLLCVAAAVLGAAWHLGAVGIALSPLVILLWRRAQSRTQAGFLAAAYYLGAATPSLATAFWKGYGALSGWELLAIATACAMLLASVWALLWTAGGVGSNVASFSRALAILVITALPGFGALGLASPLTAAGLWLGGLGWFGLAVHALLLAGGSARVLVAVVAVSVVTSGNAASADHPRLSQTTALQTSLNVPTGLHDYLGQYKTAVAVQALVPAGATVIVLPEGVGGLWTESMRRLWHSRRARVAPSQTMILGATVYSYDDQGGEHDEAAAIVLTPDGREHVVRQRAPVPGVLWRPWESAGYRSHWLHDGLVEVAGQKLAILICYEQLLVFPVLLSVAAGADALVGLANVSAFHGESLAVWQGAALGAWASLFGIPWVSSTNI